MQFSQCDSHATTDLRAGVAVRARGARWQIVDVRAYDACRLVTLAGISAPYAGAERRLLDPFDRIEPIDRRPSPRIVGARRWRAACRALIAADTPPESLRVARAARIDLMPHQLEPALAVLAGRGARVLLADEVGLGKTIQAGLVLAELRARGWIERVLVLTPSGLRDQWTHELSHRFAIEATPVDRPALRQLAATLPLGMNPWSALTVAVASTDYVKRTEVLPAAAACRWDALVVDEAHNTVGDSDRRIAVETLASRASYVLLLTATPHSGDPGAFASLCRLGSSGESGADSLLVFRRRRADVRASSRRRIHAIRVALSTAEHEMHASLARYSDAIRAEHGNGGCLSLSVLHKRAFSSPWSLSQSVARRLTTLEQTRVAADAAQIALPLGDADGEQTSADEPPDWPLDLALRDPARDRRLLVALLESSRIAARTDRKIDTLRRLLRRANEPAIVFTEYRDTLLHVQRRLSGMAVVILHGGMTREYRAAALGAFERGTRTVLLATDAAGEGLNLQRACRLVINLELPWNPMRLEQRIGRVDRIGQTRTVHGFHLVADRTGEVRIFDRLRARVARAQADIGAPDPVTGHDEARIARLAVAGEWIDEPPEGRAPPSDAMEATALETPDVRDAARHEVERLTRARSTAVETGSLHGGPLVVRASRTGLRPALGSKTLLVWQVSFDNGAGSIADSQLVAVTVNGVPRQRSQAEMTRTIHSLADRVGPTITRCSREWREASTLAVSALVATRLFRERAIHRAVSAGTSEQFQPGLFDRRAERLQRLLQQQAAASERLIADRIASVERMAELSWRPPTLLLAVLP